MNLAAHINEQAKAVNRSPTDGQKKAGNYRKGHIKVHGLDITIENPRGSFRSGTSPGGKKWKSKLPHHYGYIRRTEGADGDHVDVYVGPHLKSPHVFAIDQHRLHDRDFDEHKIFIGFGSKKQAVEAYGRSFSDGRGRDRIGHVMHLTIDGFKQWLRDGDTTKPIKRADGGAVMSEEDVFGPQVMTDADVFGAPQEEPDPGMLSAIGQGLKQGATYGFADELAGARAAAPKLPGTDWNVPEFVGPIPARTIAGGIRSMVSDEGAAEYEKARDAERRAVKAAKENRPWTYAGAELAGAVPAMAALPELGAAKMLAPAATKIAKFGAGALDAAIAGGQYGALAGAGEGEGLADRAVRSATGLVSGIVGGPLAHMIGTGVGAAAQKYGAPVVNTVRGWFNPEGESARRVAGSLRPDQEMIQAGTAGGMTPQQWAAARARGEPVKLADLGAERTQALLRSAANTSPEGRARLESTFGSESPRFKEQSERLAETIRNTVPGGRSNARRTADQIVAEYDKGRIPAYRKAYEEGDKQIFTPEMDRLTGSDIFASAMKSAISSGKDRAITEGYGSFTPSVSIGPGGNFVFARSKSGPVYPNLQYWDQVKRELDAVAKMGARSGDTERAELAGKMAKILRTELDSQVPSYSAARGIAEKYFGESNALEAGRKLAGKKVPAEDVRKIMAEMKPDERALFQEGYASDLAERVIGNIRDTRDITKAMFATPNERRMAAAIFGPGSMAQIQARMALETIMDGARKAMGNSTTARQLIEAGLAGGAVGGLSSGWDPMSVGQGILGGAGVRAGAGKLLHEEVRVGAKHLIGKVDAKTARRVAELLTSDDPRLLRQGYQMAAKSQAIMDGLKRIANRVALVGQTTARQPAAEVGRALQGPVGARAEEEQQSP